MFRKLDKHADLVNAMADKAKLDLGARLLSGQLSAQGLRNAVMLCTHCENVGACKNHLADAAETTVPGYCLNKPLFDRLG